MARRLPKRLAPVLVGLVAAALGLFTVGTSFAGPTGPGGVIGAYGSLPPHSTATATAPASATPATSPAETPSDAASEAPAGPPAGVPSARPTHPRPKPGNPHDPSSCSSCMVIPD